jgi:Biotin/lipoate A/B protein ligase family.
MASKGACEGTVIIASEQTQGRGRMGRTFFSPPSTGLYMSVILRPQLSLEDSLLITTGTAVAVAKAIETLTQKGVQIKWVNDLFMDGKKVCGILTEASLNVENGGLDYAVVGIGINVCTKDFPNDLKDLAGSIFDKKPQKGPVTSLLAAYVLNNLADIIENIADRTYLEEYKNALSFLEKKLM